MDSRQHESSFETHGYELVAYYGGGQYGRAYLVRKKGTNELRIAKTVDLSEMVSNKDAALQEANLLLGYPHKNIVPCYEAYVQNDGYLVMIMEYCQGGDLSRLLSVMRLTRKRFNEGEVRSMLRQLLCALAFIHDNRILHRDLKPSNILISSTGELKVADFGVARVLTGATCAAMTSAGTPNYMAPEMCKKRAYSYHSDMWSLGCILYEIMTLQVAFFGDSIIALAWCVCFENPKPVLFPYSNSLKTILRMLLNKEPQKRLLPRDLLRHEYFEQDLTLLMPSLTECGDEGQDDLEDEDSEESMIDPRMIFMKMLIACQLRQTPPIVCLVLTHDLWPSLINERLGAKHFEDAGFGSSVATALADLMSTDSGSSRNLDEILKNRRRRSSVTGERASTSLGSPASRNQQHQHLSSPNALLWKLLDTEVNESWLLRIGTELGVPISNLEATRLLQFFDSVTGVGTRSVRDLLRIPRMNTHISSGINVAEPTEPTELTEHAENGSFDECELIVRLRWAANVILKSSGSVTAEGTLNAVSSLTTNSNATIGRNDFLRLMGVRFVDAVNATSLAREMYKISNKDTQGNVDWTSTNVMLLKFTQHDGNPDQSQCRIIDSSLHKSIARVTPIGESIMGDADNSEHNETGPTGIETTTSSPPRPCTDLKQAGTQQTGEINKSSSTPSVRPSTSSTTTGNYQIRSPTPPAPLHPTAKHTQQPRQLSQPSGPIVHPPQSPPNYSQSPQRIDSNDFWAREGSTAATAQSPLATLMDSQQQQLQLQQQQRRPYSTALYDKPQQSHTRPRVPNMHSTYEDRNLRGAVHKIHSIHSCDYGAHYDPAIPPTAVTRVTKSLQRGDWHRSDQREDSFMYYRQSLDAGHKNGGGGNYLISKQSFPESAKISSQKHMLNNCLGRGGSRPDDGINSGNLNNGSGQQNRFSSLQKKRSEFGNPASDDMTANVTGYSPHSASSGEPPLRRGQSSQVSSLNLILANPHRRSTSSSSRSTDSSNSPGNILASSPLPRSHKSWYNTKYSGRNSPTTGGGGNSSSRPGTQGGNSSNNNSAGAQTLRRAPSGRLRAIAPSDLLRAQAWPGPPATYHIIFDTPFGLDEDLKKSNSSPQRTNSLSANSLITKLIIVGETLLAAWKRTYLHDSNDPFDYSDASRTRRFERITERLKDIRDHVKIITGQKQKARYLKEQIGTILQHVRTLSWGRSTLDGVIMGTRTVVTVLFELVRSSFGEVLSTETRRSVLDQYLHRLKLYKEMQKYSINPVKILELLDWVLEPCPSLISRKCLENLDENRATYAIADLDNDEDCEIDRGTDDEDRALNNQDDDDSNATQRQRISQPYMDVLDWAQTHNPQSQPRDSSGLDDQFSANLRGNNSNRTLACLRLDQRLRIGHPPLGPGELSSMVDDGYMFSRVSRTTSNDHPSTAMHRRRAHNDPIYTQSLLSARRRSALTSDIHYPSAYDDDEVANIRADHKTRSNRYV